MCWLGLNPKSKLIDSSCDLCVRCARECPIGRIKLLNLFLSFVLLFTTLPSESGVFDQKENYHEFDVEQNLVEKEHSETKNSGKKMYFYYFITGTHSEAHAGGELSLYLHIKTKKNIFTGPIEVKQMEEEGVIKQEMFESVTNPISIGKRSLYRMDFSFIPGLLYKFHVSSRDKKFSSFEFDFSYPKRRF